MSDEGVGKGTGEIPDGPFYPGTTQLETIEERLAALEEVQRGNCGLGMVDWLSYARLEIAMGDRGRPYS